MKSYLMVKEKKNMVAQNLFANSRVKIIAEGKRHLSAVLRVQNVVTNMCKI